MEAHWSHSRVSTEAAERCLIRARALISQKDGRQFDEVHTYCVIAVAPKNSEPSYRVVAYRQNFVRQRDGSPLMRKAFCDHVSADANNRSELAHVWPVVLQKLAIPRDQDMFMREEPYLAYVHTPRDPNRIVTCTSLAPSLLTDYVIEHLGGMRIGAIRAAEKYPLYPEDLHTFVTRLSRFLEARRKGMPDYLPMFLESFS